MLIESIDLGDSTIFLTSVAGFIGANLVLRLLSTYENITIFGLDNMSDYYDIPVTYADVIPLECDFGFKTSTSLREGLRRFAQ